MRTVYWYHIGRQGKATLILPKDSILLYGGVRQGDFAIWALVDPSDEKETEERIIRVFGTGHPIPDNVVYINTIQEGQFVWHFFEELSA